MVEDNSISKSKLVAIVDDEDDIAKLFLDALGTINGITIFAFTDPVMALEHFKLNKENYVLVISDLRMPGLTGTELIEELKKSNRFIRTILMTAFTINDNLFQEFTKKELINGFLQKPIRLDDLRAEVNNQLHTYELQKEESFIKIS
ncbi:MAG TPA: response regulator [Nitrososphaeraceae archaeon]|nr:response regulator [Nitrososphaeraceae archaeon]